MPSMSAIEGLDAAFLEVARDPRAARDAPVRDALTRFTRPLSGAFYFVPSSDAIGRFTTITAPGYRPSGEQEIADLD
ncbi:MAG: hypothetical protein ABI401_03500 [Candidatus Dormibacter sp.]